MFLNLSGPWENVQSLQEKKMGPQGRVQTLTKEKIFSASLEAVQGLLGRYFGFSLDFKFSTSDGSPYLQGLGSVHVPFSPLVFFKQSVGISSIFMMLVALLALTPSPRSDSYPGRNLAFIQRHHGSVQCLCCMWVLFSVEVLGMMRWPSILKLLAVKPDCWGPILRTQVRRERTNSCKLSASHPIATQNKWIHDKVK